MSDTICLHNQLVFEVMDQTAGVACKDCNTTLAYCWMDNHIPESLWNRLCDQDPQAKRCEQNRDNICGICKEAFDPKVHNLTT
jgi:hypothetical protein